MKPIRTSCRNCSSTSRTRTPTRALADTVSTAGTVVYLSPGVTVSVLPNMQVYAFLQKALYSNLVGYQLFPRWSGTVGVSYAF